MPVSPFVTKRWAETVCTWCALIPDEKGAEMRRLHGAWLAAAMLTVAAAFQVRRESLAPSHPPPLASCSVCAPELPPRGAASLPAFAGSLAAAPCPLLGARPAYGRHRVHLPSACPSKTTDRWQPEGMVCMHCACGRGESVCKPLRRLEWRQSGKSACAGLTRGCTRDREHIQQLLRITTASVVAVGSGTAVRAADTYKALRTELIDLVNREPDWVCCCPRCCLKWCHTWHSSVMGRPRGDFLLHAHPRAGANASSAGVAQQRHLRQNVQDWWLWRRHHALQRGACAWRFVPPPCPEQIPVSSLQLPTTCANGHTPP